MKKESRVSEVNDISQLNWDLQVETRRTRRWPAEHAKTYGNSSPEDDSWIDSDVSSIDQVKKNQQDILAFANRNPQSVPAVVRRLLIMGIAYEESEADTSDPNDPYNYRDGSWVDVHRDSTIQVITQTVAGIGPAALPLLEGRQEQFVKNAVKKIRFNQTLSKIRNVFNPPRP